MNLLERLKALFNKDDIQTDDDVVGIVQRMIDALKKLRESQKDKWTIDDVAYDVAENESVIGHAAQLLDGFDGLLAAANEIVPETVRTQIDTLTADVVAANTAAAGVLIDFAIGQGKVLAADRQPKLDALLAADDLTVAANTLLAGQSVMKTTPLTKDLKVLDMSAAQKRDSRIAAANTIMAENPGMTGETAFKRARTDKRFEGLFVSGQS